MEFMILYAYLPYKKGGIERCENCTHNMSALCALALS